MYAFIVNPHARTGLGLLVWQELEQILKQKELDYQVFITRYPGHATEFAAALTSEYDQLTLIALGGDGTINEVINGIRDFSKVTFGYIPIGSSNDFARALKLPKEPEKMLEKILNPSSFAYVNIGKMTCTDKTRRFAVSSGIGFDADVCFHNSSSKIKRTLNKLKLGKLSYTGIALYLLLTSSPRSMTLTLDGQRLSFKRVLFAAAMNHCYEGGGFKFCPKADPSDNILDLIVIADISKLKALLLLPTAFRGWHTHFKGIYTYRFQKAEIRSEQILPVHTDGEAFKGADGVSFELEPDRLCIICG